MQSKKMALDKGELEAIWPSCMARVGSLGGFFPAYASLAKQMVVGGAYNLSSQSFCVGAALVRSIGRSFHRNSINSHVETTSANRIW